MNARSTPEKASNSPVYLSLFTYTQSSDSTTMLLMFNALNANSISV